MKILFVHALADPDAGGGAEVTLWSLMRAMTSLGHECVLLAASDKDGLTKEVREGVTVYRAKLKNLYLPRHNQQRSALQKILWHALDSSNPFMQGVVKEVIAAERPDVASVHCLSGWSALSMKTLKNVGLPIVQVLHGYEYICLKSTMYRGGSNCVSQCQSCHLFRLPHRGLSQHADAVVAVSRFTLDRHLQQGYFSGVRIQRVIHNVRDPLQIGLNEAEIERSSEESFRLGYIGRLDPSKGVELLLRSFEDASLGDAQLWIAGSGQPDYEKLLRARWESEQISFIGRKTQGEFFPKVDVTVTPSVWEEPLGMVVAESLAFGRPVIGSRRGGIPEMINSGENGLLFEPDDPRELVSMIQKLARDPALRRRMSVAARESAQPFLDPKGWAAKYVNLYEEVIEAKKT